jgi:uncharacterized radical SAM superfamily Fe-S cluster-containing enzyme
MTDARELADTESARPALEPQGTALPVQNGSIEPLLGGHGPFAPCTPDVQHSGLLNRPINAISRPAVESGDAHTELEQYKLSLRRYSPVQKGIAGLPWVGQWHCLRCESTVPGQIMYSAPEDAIYLEYECPTCGAYREKHHDVLFVRRMPSAPLRQPRTTLGDFPIRPILSEFPKTVETLCPECACLILGRYYIRQNEVWMEKTCPEHGYFRDKITSDAELYVRAMHTGFEDERGAERPQVQHASNCPTDCGLCTQHHSTACLAQLDLSNRCNLTCPVCFANANQAGYLAEPSYEMVVEMLQALRDLRPAPATAIQFAGGEPTLHPDFLRIITQANRMGFSHVQIATNGIKMAERDFARRAAEAGLHTLYLQFDGLDDNQYRQLRGRPMVETKLAAVENCRELGLKISLVPTIVKTVNDNQVGEIFHFAARNADVISSIAYQPVAFTGRIRRHELQKKRYTVGDLAHDLAAATGADVKRDFFPLNHVVPLGRILQVLDPQPKIRPSCHPQCALGTYFFITPQGEGIPIPKLFDTMRLFTGFNELAQRIERQRPDKLANWRDKLDIALTFLRSYRWTERDFRVTPFTFIRSLRGMTDKSLGRGKAGRKNYRTLMAAGMHFMDRYNYDTERVRRCVILYSTPDGLYPFCTINSGPTYRPFIEKMYSRPLENQGKSPPHDGGAR